MIIPWRVDVPQDRQPYMNWLIFGAIIVFSLIWQSALNDMHDSWSSSPQYIKYRTEIESRRDISFDQKLKELDKAELKYIRSSGAWAWVLDGWGIRGIIGHMWIHRRPIHLLGNLLFLWVFGNAVCAKIGNGRYLLVYILLGLAAALTHLVLVGGPALGASGAIMGIVGMYLVFFWQNDITCFSPVYWRPFTLSSFWIILMWVGFDILGVIFHLADVGSRAAYFAHIGGFAAGVGVAMLMLSKGWVKMERYEKSVLQAWDERDKPVTVESTASPYGSFERELGLQAMQEALTKSGQDSELGRYFEASESALGVLADQDDHIRFECDCGMRIKVKRYLEGKKGKCPRCGLKLVIPKR